MTHRSNSWLKNFHRGVASNKVESWAQEIACLPKVATTQLHAALKASAWLVDKETPLAQTFLGQMSIVSI